MAMTSEQRGVYRELLDHCWETGSLPTEELVLFKISRATKCEWRRSWPVVSRQFFEEKGRLRNQKVDEKRPEIERWHEQKRNAGKRSGAVRAAIAGERSLNARSGITRTDVERAPVEPSSTTTSTSSTTTTRNSPPAPSLRRTDEQFQEFRKEAEAAGMSGSDPDWREAMMEWRHLDFEQRGAAVEGIKERARNGDNPAFLGLPKNYLARRIWQRKIHQKPSITDLIKVQE